MKRAILPGTFDPFTLGHEDLVSRALLLADEVVIAIGVNEEKRNMQNAQQRMSAISALYECESRIKVCTYQTLTIDLAEKLQAQCIIRGVRNISDFEYERNIADANRMLSGIETIILFTQPQHAHISSSLVRELIKYKRNISNLVPDKIKSTITL